MLVQAKAEAEVTETLEQLFSVDSIVQRIRRSSQ